MAQVPLGFAGPLLIDGEHAKGEFFIPMCTSEGTLVASYSRGMKLLNMCGGVKVTVVEDRMQRSPAFAFDSAREARDFVHWVDLHMEEIRGHAESSSRLPSSSTSSATSRAGWCTCGSTTSPAMPRGRTW